MKTNTILCGTCKYLEIRQTYMESIYYCSHIKSGGKKIDYSGTKMSIPKWCPLKNGDLTNN